MLPKAGTPNTLQNNFGLLNGSWATQPTAPVKTAVTPPPSPAPASKPVASTTPPPSSTPAPKPPVTGGAPVAQTNTGSTAGNPQQFQPGDTIASYNARNPGGVPGTVLQPTTYSGLVGQVSGLANPSAATNIALPLAQQTSQTTQDYIKQLEQSRTNEATALKEQGGPIPIGDITGRQGLLANYYTQQQAALGAAGQAESALFNPALSAATTGQGQQIGAAEQAASLAQPQQYSLTSTPFYPTQGNQQTGQYGTLAAGANGGSGAFQAGQVQGQLNAGQQLGGQQFANSEATGVKKTLDAFLAQNPDLNSNTLTAGNALQQWLNGQQLGDARVQTFLNDASEYVQTLAPLLGIGGTPTDAKAYLAQAFLNTRASGASISQVLQNIEALAQNKLGAGASAFGGTSPAPVAQTGSSVSGAGSTYTAPSGTTYKLPY